MRSSQTNGISDVLEAEAAASLRCGYLNFIQACARDKGEFALTPRADVSPYALCFAIFGLHLLNQRETLEANAQDWDRLLREQLDHFRKDRTNRVLLNRDKPYLQLLTFTLSALAILGTLESDPLEVHVRPLLGCSVETELLQTGALQGVSRSGNHAMFIAILLLHGRDFLNVDTSEQLRMWVSLHIRAMNRFGFWGNKHSMTHLQFQNGYHQYEIFEYLQVPRVPWDIAANSVASLADLHGHFAPYPGGGGCYDYDAVFLLTAKATSVVRHDSLLRQTKQSIVSEQNADGGFAESHVIRPRSKSNLTKMAYHILQANGAARFERLRQTLAILRPKHDCIHTHWSRYSRQWSESNLWDSWFRMLTLARIETAFDSAAAAKWGFIAYPGIGFHPATQTRPVSA
jgi:hypothetical protein